MHLTCNVQALAIALETSSTLVPAVEAVPVPVEVSFAVDSSFDSLISVGGSDMEECCPSVVDT